MHIIGRSRYAREVYPEGRLVAAGRVPARAFTPNVETGLVLSQPLAPSGSLIVVAADITPVKSGVLSIAGTFNIETSAADIVSLSLEYVAPLTAITGGTPVPGATGTLIANPTSTTPADTGGSVVNTGSAPTFLLFGNNFAFVTLTGTIQAVVGQRSGLVVRGTSINGTTWTVAGSFSVLEQ